MPPLRFPGFTEEWGVRCLEDIAEFSKGLGISKEQRSITGNPCILYGELYTTYSNEVIDEVISKTELNPIDLVKSQANDVIIPSSGETAEDIATARCVLKNDVLLGGDLNIIFAPAGLRTEPFDTGDTIKSDLAPFAAAVTVFVFG